MVEEAMNDERWGTIISELKADVPVDIEPTGEGGVSIATPDALHSLTQEEAGDLLRQLENLDYERYGLPSVEPRSRRPPAYGAPTTHPVAPTSAPVTDARSGRPPKGDYAYKLKWDGFRCLVAIVGRLRVLSRKGWEMTPRRSRGRSATAGAARPQRSKALRKRGFELGRSVYPWCRLGWRWAVMLSLP
jgi:hypothetical protein